MQYGSAPGNLFPNFPERRMETSREMPRIPAITKPRKPGSGISQSVEPMLADDIRADPMGRATARGENASRLHNRSR